MCLVSDVRSGTALGPFHDILDDSPLVDALSIVLWGDHSLEQDVVLSRKLARLQLWFQRMYPVLEACVHRGRSIEVSRIQIGSSMLLLEL